MRLCFRILGSEGGGELICARVSCYFVTLYFLIFNRGTADAEIHVSSGALRFGVKCFPEESFLGINACVLTYILCMVALAS